MIAKEVEQALSFAISNTGISVSEFTVAPEINPKSGLPYHEWFVEFENPPENLKKFENKLNLEIVKQNSYYSDLIKGKVLRPLKVTTVKKQGFTSYMKSIGKLGGQNKTPRLSNDRKIADFLYSSGMIK